MNTDVKKIVNKKNIAIVSIIILILMNMFQFNEISDYKEKTRVADMNFGVALELICFGVETLEDHNKDELLGMAILASATGQAVEIYKNTSYYDENGYLYNALFNLSSMISNNSRVKDLVEKHDFTTLIPIIEELRKDPMNMDATEKLRLYFQDVWF